MVVIILLIIVGIAAMFCLIGGIACLLAAADENQLPDSEDVEFVEDVVEIKKRKKASDMTILSAT